ncbi:hypothetical protein KGY64_05925, partial [Candidatus Bipolaricaulota bacterium]|nr:hypothetical protein [Candidatus Bipolaricaulota bacterium]
MLIETRRYGLVVALIVFFLFADGHSFADGEEPLTVCPLGCNYRDLQSAIDSAEPGGRILIKPPPFLDIPLIRKHLPDQSYKGGISIDRPLTIKAVVPHKVIIETTDWRQSPVSVQTGASQVRLKGLDIVGSGGERCTRTGT